MVELRKEMFGNAEHNSLKLYLPKWLQILMYEVGHNSVHSVIMTLLYNKSGKKGEANIDMQFRIDGEVL